MTDGGSKRLNSVARFKSYELGKRLREARNRRKWSIAVCAHQAKISESTLKSIEAGDPKVGWFYYLLLLQCYGMLNELDGLCSKFRDGCRLTDIQPDEKASEFDVDI